MLKNSLATLAIAAIFLIGCQQKKDPPTTGSSADSREPQMDDDYMTGLEIAYEEAALSGAKKYWVFEAEKLAWLDDLEASATLRTTVLAQLQAGVDNAVKYHTAHRGTFVERYKKDYKDWMSSFASRYPEKDVILKECEVVGRDRAKAQAFLVSEHLSEQSQRISKEMEKESDFGGASALKKRVHQYRDRYLADNATAYADQVRREVMSLPSVMKLRAKIQAAKSQQ